MLIRPMREDERSAVHDLLHDCRLPLDGFDAPHVAAVIARDGAGIVGSAAVEVYGAAGLLRSVAVRETHRGQGLGERLTRAAIDAARAHGVVALYLLTETASGFFPKFGFVPVSRTNIPAAVTASVEFTSACPASAQAFHLSLTKE